MGRRKKNSVETGKEKVHRVKNERPRLAIGISPPVSDCQARQNTSLCYRPES